MLHSGELVVRLAIAYIYVYNGVRAAEFYNVNIVVNPGCASAVYSCNRLGIQLLVGVYAFEYNLGNVGGILLDGVVVHVINCFRGMEGSLIPPDNVRDVIGAVDVKVHLQSLPYNGLGKGGAKVGNALYGLCSLGQLNFKHGRVCKDVGEVSGSICIIGIPFLTVYGNGNIILIYMMGKCVVAVYSELDTEIVHALAELAVVRLLYPVPVYILIPVAHGCGYVQNGGREGELGIDKILTVLGRKGYRRGCGYLGDRFPLGIGNCKHRDGHQA